MIPARMCLESLDRRPGIREQPGSLATFDQRPITSALPRLVDVFEAVGMSRVGPRAVIPASGFSRQERCCGHLALSLFDFIENSLRRDI